jgi:hypothetical protein
MTSNIRAAIDVVSNIACRSAELSADAGYLSTLHVQEVDFGMIGALNRTQRGSMCRWMLAVWSVSGLEGSGTRTTWMYVWKGSSISMLHSIGLLAA